MIRIGTSDVNPEIVAPALHNMKLCACQDSPVGQGQTQAFQCGTRGRYLVVLLDKKIGLTLCEVEVFEGKFLNIWRPNLCYNGFISQVAFRY